MDEHHTTKKPNQIGIISIINLLIGVAVLVLLTIFMFYTNWSSSGISNEIVKLNTKKSTGITNKEASN